MTHAQRLPTFALVGAALLAAAPTLAQTPPAAPAAPAAGTQLTNPGPALPGVCILDNQRAIGTSSVGRAVQTRLQQLGQQVSAELQPQQTALQTEESAIRTAAQAAGNTPNPALQTRYQTFQQRVTAYDQLVRTRQAEMQATEQQQLQRIAVELQPVVNQVYGQRGCGILIERGSIVAANPAMDITDGVVQGLNARIQTLTFERVRAPAAAPGAAPAAAAPAAAAPAPGARPAAPPAGPRRR